MDSTIKFLTSWILFSIVMGSFLIPFCFNYKQVVCGGFILGFFAGVLSQIEGNTRK